MSRRKKMIYGRLAQEHLNDKWEIPGKEYLIREGKRCLILSIKGKYYDVKIDDVKVRIPRDRLIVESGKCHFSVGDIHPLLGNMQINIVDIEKESFKVQDKQTVKVGLAQRIGRKTWLLMDHKGDQYYYRYVYDNDDMVYPTDKVKYEFGFLKSSVRNREGFDLKINALDARVYDRADYCDEEFVALALHGLFPSYGEKVIPDFVCRVMPTKKCLDNFVRVSHLGKIGEDDAVLYASYPAGLYGGEHTRTIVRVNQETKK